MVRVFSVIAVTVVAVMAYACPLKHNPDGNVHFLTALKVLQGSFVESVDGVQSPLLGWLIAIPSAAGMPIPWAARLVSLVLFALLLAGVDRLCRSRGFSPVQRVGALAIVATIVAYSAVRLVTSDLLAAVVTVWFLSAASALPLLLALAYYAKAFQFLILLPVVFLLQPWRRAIVSISISALLCAPWWLALSMKYGKPTFSAQQFLITQELSLTYSPNNLPRAKSVSAIPAASPLDVSQMAQRRLQIIRFSFESLTRLLRDLVFSSTEILGVFILLVVLGAKTIPPLAGFALIQILLYALVWGAYPRYLFPALPALACLAMAGIYQLRLPAVRSLLYLVIMLGILNANILAAKNDWHTTSSAVYEKLMSLPSLRQNNGVIAGGAVSDPYAPLVAYAHRRPFWLYLDSYSTLPPQELVAQLKREEIVQILLVGQDRERLSLLPGVRLQESGAAEGTPYYLYTVE